MGQVIGSVLFGIGKTMLTEKFVKWAIFQLAGMLVAKTDTLEDDKWLEEIRKAVYGEDK